MANESEGWHNPRPGATYSKSHYFAGGRSLCGRWPLGDPAFGLLDRSHHGQCEACRRKLAARAAPGAAKGADS